MNLGEVSGISYCCGYILNDRRAHTTSHVSVPDVVGDAVDLILYPLYRTDLNLISQRYVIRRYAVVSILLDDKLIDIYLAVNKQVIVLKPQQIPLLQGIMEAFYFSPALLGLLILSGHVYLVNLWRVGISRVVVLTQPVDGLDKELDACRPYIVGFVQRYSKKHIVVSLTDLIGIGTGSGGVPNTLVIAVREPYIET